MAKPDIDRAGGQMLRWSSTNDLVAGDDEVAGDDSGDVSVKQNKLLGQLTSFSILM